MNTVFQRVKNFLLGVLIFIFPFFFLPFTQEYFITNKLFLVGFFILLLLLIAAVEPIFTKKIYRTNKALDIAVVLFVLSTIVSTIVSSPNKVQAVLNPSFSVVMIMSLSILYFFVSRLQKISDLSNIFRFTSTILSFITIILFFIPLIKDVVPSFLKPLVIPSFNTFGNYFDLAFFLGFLLIMQISKSKDDESNLSKVFVSGVILVALSLIIFSLSRSEALVLPPFKLSWYSALEILKNLKTAIFGVGLDNFSTVFTKVKDSAFNQSPLWQIDSFNVARTTPIHVFVETGILGLISFVFLILKSLQTVFKNRQQTELKPFLFTFVYIIVYMLFFPPSLTTLFLFYVNLGILQVDDGKKVEYDNDNLFGVVNLGLIGFIVLVFVGGYFLTRSYLSEIYFKIAINGITKNNAKTVYDNMKKARILNPYEERYILNFSKTNLLIANGIINNAKDKITEQDRQTIAQAVQAAISEAKTLITLHNEKAQYYENLGSIYQSIIPLAKESDVWAISSYQRAVILDPNNPIYRLQLGGLYYLLGSYNDAIGYFQQAVILKPDWPNAYYNLAWGYYQSQQYDKATNAMENVVKLVNRSTNPKDYDKAEKELNTFKNKLTEVRESTSSGELNLPKSNGSALDPKLNLPDESAFK